jgi:FkbM family methyltransferase
MPVAGADTVTLRHSTKEAILALVRAGRKTRVGRYVLRQMLDSAMGETRRTRHGGIDLAFVAPNQLCEWRTMTFASKEPETLDWIDAMPEGAILWDIGANVGLYSVYAAKKRRCQVWAFEPSVFNLELLARNIQLNGVAANVCILPLALNDALGPNALRMTTTEWGGALSTFGRDFDWRGRPLDTTFEFRTMGLTMDLAAERLAIPQPAYIKIDVDGIEHFILKGGTSVLRGVRQVLIEVNDEFRAQADACEALLTQAGLVLRDKQQSEMIAASTIGYQTTFNQIWVRP